MLDRNLLHLMSEVRFVEETLPVLALGSIPKAKDSESIKRPLEPTNFEVKPRFQYQLGQDVGKQ